MQFVGNRCCCGSLISKSSRASGSSRELPINLWSACSSSPGFYSHFLLSFKH